MSTFDDVASIVAIPPTDTSFNLNGSLAVQRWLLSALTGYRMGRISYLQAKLPSTRLPRENLVLQVRSWEKGFLQPASSIAAKEMRPLAIA